MKKYPQYKILKNGDRYCPCEKKSRFSRIYQYICWVSKDDACSIIKKWRDEEIVTMHTIEEICGDCQGENMKYRIAQKGNKYNPQWKGFLFWRKFRTYSENIDWMSLTGACSIVKGWQEEDKFNSYKETHHDPKDICNGE